MRILFVLHTFPPESWGGTELHVRGVARVLARRHDVRVFVRSGNPERHDGDIQRSYQDGFLLTRVNNLGRDGENFESTWRDPDVHDAFVRELEAFRPDVVHVHHLTGLSTSIIEACKERGLPVVFSLHDFWTVCPRGQRLYVDNTICERIERNKCYNCLQDLWPAWFPDRLAEPTVVDDQGRLSPEILSNYDRHMRYILGLCDVLLTPSDFHRRRMLETGIDPEGIQAIAHGLDHDIFAELSDPTRPVRVIAYMGSVIPPKGVHILIEAFRLLGRRDLELRVYGPTPQFHEKSNYRDELRSLGLGAGSVRFMGEYEALEVPEILAEVDVLCVPSLWWETFSLTIREAMLAGVPVVASDIGAMKEALERTRAGLLFRAGDAEDLARQIRRLIEDVDLRTEVSNHRLDVKTIKQNAEDYLGVYEEAKRRARERRARLVVATPTFRRRKPMREADAPVAAPKDSSKPAPASEMSGDDCKIDIRHAGAAGAQVSYSLRRGDATSVTFVISYPDGAGGTGEVQCSVDFAGSDGQPIEAVATERQDAVPALPADTHRDPQPRATPSMPPLPADAGDSAARMMQTQTPSFEDEETDRAMYRHDGTLFAGHVRKLDDMVGATHLDDDDVEEAPKKSQARRRRRPDNEDAKGGDDRDRRRDEGGSRRRESSSPDDDRRGSRRSRPNDDGAKGRRDRRPAPDRERRSDKPSHSRSTPKPQPQSKPKSKPSERRPEPAAAKPTSPAKADGDSVVWGNSKKWSLPQTSDSSKEVAPKPKAANHRSGPQPRLASDKEGTFGEGL